MERFCSNIRHKWNSSLDTELCIQFVFIMVNDFFENIVSHQAEQQHFLDEDVTTTAIKHFILNYTMSNLTRHLRSSSHSKPSICSQASSICVQEVVSSTFEELVLDNNKVSNYFYLIDSCHSWITSVFHELHQDVAGQYDTSHLWVTNIWRVTHELHHSWITSLYDAPNSI